MSIRCLAREVVGSAALIWALVGSASTCFAQGTSQSGDHSSDTIVASFDPGPLQDGLNVSGNRLETQSDEAARACTWVKPSDFATIAGLSAVSLQDGSQAGVNGIDSQCDDSATSTKAPCVREYKTLYYDEDWSFLKDPSKCCDCW